jgi:hypothetical protein
MTNELLKPLWKHLWAVSVKIYNKSKVYTSNFYLLKTFMWLTVLPFQFSS